jgi:hypothetical protein
MAFHSSTHFVKPNRSKGNEPVNLSDTGDIAFPKSLFDLDEIVPVKSFIPLAIRRTGAQYPFHLIRRDGIPNDLKMGMEDGASPGKEEILADLPVTGIRVEGHRSSNDFNGNRKTLFVNFRGELVEIKKMFLAEHDHTAMGPHWAEIRKTDGFPDRDPSFWSDLF